MNSRKDFKKARKNGREATVLDGGNIIGVAENGATVVQYRALRVDDEDDFDTQIVNLFIERGETNPLFAALAPILKGTPPREALARILDAIDTLEEQGAANG